MRCSSRSGTYFRSTIGMFQRKSTTTTEAERTGEKTMAWGERKTERAAGGSKRKLLHLNDEKQRLSHRGEVE